MIDTELREVLIQEDSKAESDSKDDDREEMKWSHRQEEYVNKIKNECLDLQKQHDAKAHVFKKRYVYFSIPTIVLPLILSSINETLVEEFNYINTIGMMLSGIISGLNTFFNFGSKYESHNNFAGKYDELAGEIESTMAKPKRFRLNCDVYIEKIKSQYVQLNNNSPML